MGKDDAKYRSEIENFLCGLEELYLSREFSESEIQLALIRSLVTLGEMNLLLSDFEGAIRKLSKTDKSFPADRIRVSTRKLAALLSSFTADAVYVYGPVVKVLDSEQGVDSIKSLMKFVKGQKHRR